MDNNYTHITLVLDKSGSMFSCWEQTIAGVNSFFKKQKELPGKVTITVVQFNTGYEVWHHLVDLSLIPKLNMSNYRPGGGTALLDAMGKAIGQTGDDLASLPEHARPGKVIIVTQSDGEELDSHQYSWGQIKDMIRHQESKYNWNFVFLGANQDAIATASKMGISASSSITYNTSKSCESFDTLSSYTSRYRTCGVSCFTDAERSTVV